MNPLGVVERGYEAVAAGDREVLLDFFAEDATWVLMDRDEVARTFEGRERVVDFLLRIDGLRLEAIMHVDESVVAAHSFDLRSGGWVITTTVYDIRDGVVVGGKCADILSVERSGVAFPFDVPPESERASRQSDSRQREMNRQECSAELAAESSEVEPSGQGSDHAIAVRDSLLGVIRVLADLIESTRI